jgi:hypothetical protein
MEQRRNTKKKILPQNTTARASAQGPASLNIQAQRRARSLNFFGKILRRLPTNAESFFTPLPAGSHPILA